ncbi:MAG: mevalonate kinase [Lactobacillales bacterium]|jgi:mevalonate kinase|nr:mevalonate kinase [Lactobacillales bacterium]
MTVGIGTATGKIILIGEHSVVFGEPAIAFPFPPAKIQAIVTEAQDTMRIKSSYFEGKLEDAPSELANLKAIIPHALKILSEPDAKLLIDITSTIPAERGMGSSAAVAVAVTRALFDFYGLTINSDMLFDLVQEAEIISHGNPSGIDASATSGAHPIYFIKNHPITTFEMNLDGYLVVADTGIKGQTREAVMDVATYVKEHDEEGQNKITALGLLATEAKLAIRENQLEALGTILNDAQTFLAELGVSNETLDTLIDTALSAGALGAKLSGGGRGGIMIALAENLVTAQKIEQALQKAGAKQTWNFNLGVE